MTRNKETGDFFFFAGANITKSDPLKAWHQPLTSKAQGKKKL